MISYFSRVCPVRLISHLCVLERPSRSPDLAIEDSLSLSLSLSVSWWDILSTVGEIMIHVGDVISTMGGVQYEYRGGNHDTCGGCHKYHRRCSVPWRYLNNKRLFPPMY